MSSDVPEVRENRSGNGQPAGLGSTGSARVAASGTPLGRPWGGGCSTGGMGSHADSSRTATATTNRQMP